MEGLSVEDLRVILDYESESGLLRWRLGRGRVRSGSIAGHVNGCGYLNILISGKTYQAHRLAWTIACGKWPAGNIDHIDGDPLNNRIANLRECSSKENSWNRSARKSVSSGVRNVSFCVCKGLVYARARVSANGLEHEKYFSVNSHGLLKAGARAAEWASDKRKEVHGLFAIDHRPVLIVND